MRLGLIGENLMLNAFVREVARQFRSVREIMRTREFWMYVVIIAALFFLGAICVRMALGFDPLTRGLVGLGFTCKTGEGQLATIIVGGFVFGLAALFTLGEVVHWIEETRASRAPGRRNYEVNFWRPVLHVAGTLMLGVSGYALMLSWCT
jgi:hypothetical protein